MPAARLLFLGLALAASPARADGGLPAGADGGAGSSLADGGVPALFVPSSVAWRYYPGTTHLPTDWTDCTFDDLEWEEGRLPLGYGVQNLATTVPDAPLTVYARARFSLYSPASVISSLEARADFADGFVLFINGQEALRRNVPTDQTRNTPASAPRKPGAVETFSLGALLTALHRGENCVAVEVHNDAFDSPDLYLDLELGGLLAPAPPPAVRGISPAMGATLVPLAAPIHFLVQDAVGVAAGSVKVLLGGEPAAAEFEGVPQRWRVTTLPPEGGWPAQTRIEVEVQAANLAGVALTPTRWSFVTDEAKPPLTPPDVGCGASGAAAAAPFFGLWVTSLAAAWRPRPGRWGARNVRRPRASDRA